jgi:hypothetical protein
VSDGEVDLRFRHGAVVTAVFLSLAWAPPSTAAGSPPTGPTAIALDRQVELAWQPVVGASAYTVYRGTSPTAITTAITPLGGLAAPATSFVDTGAANATTYYYAVRAVVSGVESSNSLVVQATPAARGCATGNAVALENCFPGSSAWNVRSTAQMPAGIEGYATAQSVDRGGSLAVKVNSGAGFNIEIYRTGWYGGTEARLFSIVRAVPGTLQPACATPFDGTGLVDCANWTPSATITTTASWPSGVYVLRLVRADNGNDNQVLFVVRDDGHHHDLIYGEGMTTLQAYNNYEGRSLYDFNSFGSNTVAGTPRAVKVSFDRPFEQPRSGLRDWYTRTEIATVAWLEQNGYDVSYISDGDLETTPSLLLNAGAYVSPAHEEYVSAAMRSAFEQARAAGVSLFFTGSNEIYWKIRFESSPTTGAAARTEVCYKTVQSGPSDPSGISTSTWRDPNGANNPENALLGGMYIGDNDSTYFPFVVNSSQGQDRIYRYTGLDQLAPGSSASIGNNLVGWEWNARVANGREPAGEKTLSVSPVTGELVQNSGASYLQNQNATVSLVKYRAASGALVVSTGTNHWNRGLARNAVAEGEPNLDIQQTTVNILADMGARPSTPQAGIVLDPPPGTAPGGVSATAAGSDSIAISWSAAAGATGYNVYRATAARDGGYALGFRVNPSLVTGTSFTDVELASGTTYYYVVTAVADGAEGAPSSEVSAQTIPFAAQPVRINVGGGAYTTASGVGFRADSSFSGGTPNSTTLTISGTNDPALYQDERWGQFGYSIPVANGTYDLRFHFVELYFGTVVSGSCVGKRIFGMDVLDTPTSPDIQNLDVCALVGPRAALMLTVKGVQVMDGALDIRSVTGTADAPELAAVSVVPAAASTAAPTVTATSPASGATGVAATVQPTATFSRSMDATTITSSSFVLRDAAGTAVTASISYDSATLTARLAPGAALAASTAYTATLGTAVKAADGTALAAPVSWTFTTAAAADTTPPTVAISSPAGGATVGGTVTVSASASDDVGVAGVQFRLDGANLGAEDTSSPYSAAWDTRAFSNGSHTLTAIARDAAGNTATAASVTVTVSNAVSDTTPPTVAITSPAGGATVTGTVKVTAAASDAGSGVAAVSFFLDGASLATATNSSYTINWNTRKSSKGTHVLTAVARDNAGNTQQSAGITVTVR